MKLAAIVLAGCSSVTTGYVRDEVARVSACSSDRVDVRERTDENASMVVDIAWAKLVPPSGAAADWKAREHAALHRHYDGWQVFDVTDCDGRTTTQLCQRGPTCITVVPPGETMLDAAAQ